MSEGVSSDEFFRGVRQGQVVSVADGSSTDGAQWLVVISQTCDVVKPNRPTVTFARVVTFDGADLAQARKGESPRHVALPMLGGGYFADLSYVVTKDKTELAGVSVSAGIDLANERTKRDFSLAIARWFSRFPYPDEVVPWLNPLVQLIRKKYKKNSSLGALLRDVIVEVRVQELGQWTAAPYRLVIHTIVKAEYLSTKVEDEVDNSEVELAERLYHGDKPLPPHELANIYVSATNSLQRELVLDALAQSFAASCVPAERDRSLAGVLHAVSPRVEGRLSSDDEFSLAEYRKSELLDVEYLSTPEQRAGGGIATSSVV